MLEGSPDHLRNMLNHQDSEGSAQWCSSVIYELLASLLNIGASKSSTVGAVWLAPAVCQTCFKSVAIWHTYK